MNHIHTTLIRQLFVMFLMKPSHLCVGLDLYLIPLDYVLNCKHWYNNHACLDYIKLFKLVSFWLFSLVMWKSLLRPALTHCATKWLIQSVISYVCTTIKCDGDKKPGQIYFEFVCSKLLSMRCRDASKFLFHSNMA